MNVGVHSTPNYPALAAKAYHDLGGNRMVFAGQRADGFHVDLGSIFDLGDLRPFQGAYNNGIPPVLADMPGVNGLRGPQRPHDRAAGADQRPDRRRQRPTDVMSAKSVIGVWATASRTTARVLDAGHGQPTAASAPIRRSRGWATR